jgi:hypothetical protein
LTGRDDKSIWTDQPERDREDKTAGHDSKDRIAGTRELRTKLTKQAEVYILVQKRYLLPPPFQK